MHPVLNLLLLRYVQENQMEMSYVDCSAHPWCPAQIPSLGLYFALSCSDIWLLTAHTCMLILETSPLLELPGRLCPLMVAVHSQ